MNGEYDDGHIYVHILSAFTEMKISVLYSRPKTNPKSTKMKSFVILASALFVFSLSSCKKDHDCTCTTTGGGVTITSTTTINDTKSNAEDACDALESTVGTLSTTCSID